MKHRRAIRPRKVVIRAGIFLLLITGGAIVNVAVAWGCALWSWNEAAQMIAASPEELDQLRQGLDAGWHAPNNPHKELRSDLQVDSSLRTEASWRDSAEGAWHRTSAWIVGVGTFGIQTHQLDEAFWMGDKGHGSLTFIRRKAGWPCYGLESHQWRLFRASEGGQVDVFSQWSIEPGIIGLTPMEDTHASIMGMARQLPLRPLWPGFAINTLFYAAILWLLLALPGALRRWRRSKRGLCPACAYPVGTSDLCTECGRPIPARLRGRVERAS